MIPSLLRVSTQHVSVSTPKTSPCMQHHANTQHHTETGRDRVRRQRQREKRRRKKRRQERREKMKEKLNLCMPNSVKRDSYFISFSASWQVNSLLISAIIYSMQLEFSIFIFRIIYLCMQLQFFFAGINSAQVFCGRVTLCSAFSKEMVSDFSVTCLLIPFTIRTQEAVPS